MPGSKVETSLTPCITWKEKIFFLKDKKEKDESYGRSEAELDTWTEYFCCSQHFSAHCLIW